MTVLDNTPRDQYTATGGQVAFSYTFEIAAEGDIAVLQNGVLLSLGTGAGEYAVTGVGSDTGGVVTLVTGATSGDIITLYRDMALERLTSYTNGGDFLAADVNNDYDRLWLALQQNTGTSNRALVAPNTDPTNINMTIPDKATRLNKFLKFNENTGNPEVSDATGLYVSAGMHVYNFTGDGTTVNFTLGTGPGSENNTQIYIDGVYQQKDGYNLSGSIVQFSVAPPNLSTIEVMVVEALPVGATTASQVSFTQAGSTYGRNVQLKLQESVSVKDFGAVGDGVTDDTAAIQAAINHAASNQIITVFFPAGIYNFTKLYLNYDAVNNPGYPSQDDYRGRIRLQGVGCGSYRNWLDNTPVGTVLRSTDVVGPAVYCNGDPLGEGQNRTDYVQIFDMAIWANNSTWAVKFEKVTQSSGFERVYIGQNGSGGGIEWTEFWLCFMRDVRIDGAGLATSSYGLYMTNLASGLSGGIYELTRVNVNGFNISWQLGHPTYGLGGRMHSLVLNGCQGGDANYGMKIGHGIDQVVMAGCHFESNDVGISITRGAQAIKVQGSSFVNGRIYAQLGDNTADGDRYTSINFDGNLFLSDSSTEKHFEIYSSGNTDDVILQRNIHTGDVAATDTAIWLEDVNHHHLRLISPTFNVNLSTNIDNANRIQEYYDEQKVVWRTVNAGGVLTETPFQFKADSITGAQPVIDLHQADNDTAFLKFSTDSAAGGGAAHINTTNSGAVTGPGDGAWTFSVMAKVQVETSGGIADYWMPLFTKV